MRSGSRAAGQSAPQPQADWQYEGCAAPPLRSKHKGMTVAAGNEDTADSADPSDGGEPNASGSASWGVDWTERAQRTGEKVSDVVFAFAIVTFALGGVLPIAIIIVVGFFAGTLPGEAAGGLMGVGSGYPAFNPQNWLLWLPAGAMLFLAFWTIPSAVRGFHVSSRSTWAGATLTMFFLGLGISSAFVGAPGVAGEGILAVLVFAVAWVLFALRALAGVLRLVPKNWRDDTTLVPVGSTSDPHTRRSRKSSPRT